MPESTPTSLDVEVGLRRAVLHLNNADAARKLRSLADHIDPPPPLANERAGDGYGGLLWQHGCGGVMATPWGPSDADCKRCTGRGERAEWRALYVQTPRIEEERAEAADDAYRLRALAHWLISLDDPDGPGADARRTVTLTQIINRARAALDPRRDP